jgi:hypothetical protein
VKERYYFLNGSSPSKKTNNYKVLEESDDSGDEYEGNVFERVDRKYKKGMCPNKIQAHSLHRPSTESKQEAERYLSERMNSIQSRQTPNDNPIAHLMQLDTANLKKYVEFLQAQLERSQEEIKQMRSHLLNMNDV